MNRIVRKYFVCVAFSLLLFILVWLSEIIHDIMLVVSSGLSSGIFILMAYSVLILFLFVCGIIPSILLVMWFLNPKLMEKLFSGQFGLTERLLDKKKKKETEDPPTT